jgi:hypothetical protein
LHKAISQGTAASGGAASQRFRSPLQAVKIIDSKIFRLAVYSPGPDSQVPLYQGIGIRSRMVASGMADA